MSAAPVVLTATRPPRGARLYRDALSLASSSMLTAVLGMGFWAISARLVDPATLGVQTALLSIMVAPAIVVASGFGDAFTSLVPAAGALRAAVIHRGYRLLVIVAAVAGTAAGTVAVIVLPQVRGSIPVAALIAVGVVIWAMFIVQDPALTSMRRAHWLPIENGAVSAAKIALLPLALAVGIAQPILIATLLPSIVAVAVLYPQVRRLSHRPMDADSGVTAFDAVAELPRLARRTTASVAMSLGTLTVTPFIVTAAAGPIEGAVFSLCLSIVQALDFVGAALGVSLVVHASAQAERAGAMALAVFKRTAAVVGVGALALIVVAPIVLRMLNASYIDLHGPLVVAILAGGSFARSIYVIWAALQRSRRRMRSVLTLNATAAVAVFVALPFCARDGGAVGAAIVVAGAQILLSTGAGVHLLWCHHRGGRA